MEVKGICIGDFRKPASYKIKASLSQWQIQKRSGKWCVFAEVVSHPNHIEGENIITSPLLFVCFKTMTAETEDMVYILL